MFVIGSRALHFHKNLIDREPSDWDILCDKKPALARCFKNTEIYAKNHPLDKTNLEIFNYCFSKIDTLKKINTPMGMGYVAPLEILKVLKLSCQNELNKFKHELDLKLYLNDVELSPYLLDLAQRRKIEIQNRVSEQKKAFFNKYPIVRYIDHDLIHKEISDSPAYLKIIKQDGVSVCPQKFQLLTLKEKCDVIREECFVLAMERFFIFNYKTNPGSLYSLSDAFQDTSNSAKPMLFWLQKLAIQGAIKDNPDWISKWLSENYLEVLKDMDSWWINCFHSISESFWQKII